MCALLWPLLEKHAAPKVEVAGEAQLAGVAAENGSWEVGRHWGCWEVKEVLPEATCGCGTGGEGAPWPRRSQTWSKLSWREMKAGQDRPRPLKAPSAH